MKIKILILFLLSVASISYSADFKKIRTNKISPLSDGFNSSSVSVKPSAFSALSEFNLKNSVSGSWRVKFEKNGAYPEILAGDKTKVYGLSVQKAFSSFLSENKSFLGILPDDLKKEREISFAGMSHIEYKQYYKGLPVEFSSVKGHFDKEGRLTLYRARYYRDINLDINPSFSSSFAENTVRSDAGNFLKSKEELVVFPKEDGNFYLAWKITGRGGKGAQRGLWVYYVDAHSGNILFSYDDTRYACTSPYNVSTGTVKGYVYDISPIPTGTSDLREDFWQPKILANLDNQYVWVGNVNNRVITGVSNGASSGTGEYCSNSNARVFSLLQGPYFAVSRFMAPSSYFTNGSASWTTQSTPVSSPNPYSNNATYDYNVLIDDNWTDINRSFAFGAPIFSSFRAGSMDTCGGALDSDHLEISSGTYRTAYYIGNKNNFLGALTPYFGYKLRLKTDSSGVYSGFSVSVSSYMTIANASASNATGSIIWSTTTNLRDGNGGEVNAFYHLNKAKSYFDLFNKNPNGIEKPINIDKQIPVMTQVFSDVMNDYCVDANYSMWNAFYDLQDDYIFLGRGPMDVYGSYRDFALDGTIIRHEYIHLIVNRIYPIINFGEFGAISEALADYFALSSFWNEGKTSLKGLGNFIGQGEGAARDISTSVKKIPDDWVGEVHDDSLILSPALYKIRLDPTYSLGNVSNNATFNGLPRADVYVFSAIFYFPDNFTNFLEAVLDSCRNLEGAVCDATLQNKIKNAFAAHGIYPAASQSYSDKYEPNNGPQWATNFSTFSSLAAFIDYSGDLDYYSIPLNEGLFVANMTLPQGSVSQMYHGYSLFLFDQNRNYLVESVPEIYSCPPSPGSKECLTLSQTNSLSYNITVPGRYYLMVSAAPSEYGGNSADYNSSKPYILSWQGNIKGSAQAWLYSSALDADEFRFRVKYPKFEYIASPASATWTSGAEVKFSYARLLDHNKSPIPLTETNNSSSYMEVSYTPYYSLDSQNNPIIEGRVRLKSGFAARYPAIGTVYLEIFGTNHMWDLAKASNTVSLGITDALSLTTNKSDFTVYNNIINSSNSKTYLKYDAQGAGDLSIKVYTASGHIVKTIYKGQISAGKGTFEWDGTNENGSKVASGIYFIKTEGPGINKVERVAIIR
ncbi:MAG: FlgD immunoglobulin-like domain containing protein [Elusimicrobiota bacterium]